MGCARKRTVGRRFLTQSVRFRTIVYGYRAELELRKLFHEKSLQFFANDMLRQDRMSDSILYIICRFISRTSTDPDLTPDETPARDVGSSALCSVVSPC